MKKPITFESVGFELVSSMEEAKATPEPDEPFRICVLGDFSGRASRGVREPVAARKPVLVDRDNLDEVIGKFKPRVVLDVAGQKIETGFETLDDFHPDELFRKIPLFQTLQSTRRKIDDPRTFNAALKDLRVLAGLEEGEKDAKPKTQENEKPASTGGSLLDDIIGESGGGAPAKHGTLGEGDLASFVNAIVKPYSVQAQDPAQDRIREAFDGYISLLMAEMLHSRAFQEIEAAWRSVYFLVSRAETDENLEIRLLDISREELAADLLSTDDPASTGAYRLFAGERVSSPEGKPWALLIGNYTFAYDDAAILGRMAQIAAIAGAPFIARAHPHLVGARSLAKMPDPADWRFSPDDETAQEWDALRRLPEAAYLGLAAPGFLLRLPYGRDTDEIESFAFEEMPDGPVHEHYLWGNPAFACACLLAESFSREGWELTPGSVHDIEGLPLHSFELKGESGIKPCAEVLLSDKAIEAVLDKGVMPLASIKGADAARLVRFQSLAIPPAMLKGRWGGRG